MKTKCVIGCMGEDGRKILADKKIGRNVTKLPGQPAPNEVMFEAMEKQEPIAPRMKPGNGDCVRFFCPCCSNTRHHVDFGQKYCDECGQKLDWSPYR